MINIFYNLLTKISKRKTILKSEKISADELIPRHRRANMARAIHSVVFRSSANAQTHFIDINLWFRRRWSFG